MNFLLRQNASKLFLFVIATCLTSLMVIGTLAVTTVSQVKIGSDLHDQIIDGKDLIADMSPPRAFIVESYQMAANLLDIETEKQAGVIAELNRGEKEFQDRLAVWAPELVEHKDDPSALKMFNLLLEDSRRPAEAFFNLVKEKYLPAIKAGNRELARDILVQEMQPAFEQHRKAILETIKIANAHNTTIAQNAAAAVTRSSRWLFSGIAGAIVFVLAIGTIMFRLIRTSEERNRDFTGRFNAIDRSQAVIEFKLDGTIITANENFLSVTGYTLDEIRGKHHSMFVKPELVVTAEYKQLWSELNAGQYVAGQFERFGRGGKQIWLQSSYNPIFDPSGKPFKVIKYASDITEAKKLEAAIAERQKAEELAAVEMRSRVNEILAVAERVAQRDYSVKLNVRGNDEIGKLGEGLARFFEDKQAAEAADQARAEQDRALAAETDRKVATVLDVVNAVAAGRFDIKVPTLGDDAVGQVASALRTAVASMRTALMEVRNVAETVSTASQQLDGVSREISSGAQSQASSLEETASSLEEITSTVKQNTDNAQQARQLANGSRDVAERGGAVVHQAVIAMEEINQSSKRISDIITTIDEIAFQTNLLALNAAVEAARAGEQGRGFAVVAAEVRNLAQRSASAAREIKVLIKDSVEKVQNGTQLVNESGQTLGEIVISVKRVTDIVAEIAAASKEQLVGIEQVNKAVSQMDRVTQANAAQTEEMSGTAGMLLSHAEQLSELVSGFELDEQPRDKGNKQKAKPSATARKSERETRFAPVTVDSIVSDTVNMLEF